MRNIALYFGVLTIAAALSGCERYKLDQRMEELCKKDGGIRVYETVKLSHAEYEELHRYAGTAKAREDYFGPEYLVVQRLEHIVGEDADPNSGRGRLSRGYTAIIRRSDNRLLGEQVQYFRRGGDWFHFASHPSGSACPRFDRDVNQSVFLKSTAHDGGQTTYWDSFFRTSSAFFGGSVTLGYYIIAGGEHEATTQYRHSTLAF